MKFKLLLIITISVISVLLFPLSSIAQYITEDPAENDINYIPPSSTSKKKGQKGGFFSNRVLYQTMLADPRKIQYSFGVRLKDTAWYNYETNPLTGTSSGIVGSDRAYWSFSIGDRIGLYLFDLAPGHSLQIETEACIWSIFSIISLGNYLMLNTDFRVGIPITYSWNDFSIKFTYYHESSHLGDEFIKYGINEKVFALNQRVNPSSEVLEIFFSYMLIKEIRFYTGIGVHLTVDSSYPVKPIYVDYGLEFRPFDKWTFGAQAMLQLFAGVHLRTIQDTAWDPDLTVALGLEILPTGDDTRRRIRLYGEYHYGYSVEGQFSRNKTDYFNIMLAFGF